VDGLTLADGLRELATDVLTTEECDAVRSLVLTGHEVSSGFSALDARIGGPLWYGAPQQDHYYHLDDREVFRPLQYCQMYIGRVFADPDGSWFTRSTVQMGGLHLESLVKRVAVVAWGPLGQIVSHNPVFKQRIAADQRSLLLRFARAYNLAKHDVSHPMGTHLFSLEDALCAYLVARKLGVSLYPFARLRTSWEAGNGYAESG